MAIFFVLPVNGQAPAVETSSNFVNFNLNRINMVRSYLPEFNGKGMVASIKEFQYDTLDIDFSGRHIPHPRSAGEVSPHSTLMATIIGGGGNTFLSGQGTAWAAQITSSSFLDIFPDDNRYFQDLGISVQNHSYGIDRIENFYGPIASAYDLQISQMPHLLHVFSLGNLGAETPTSGPYADVPGYANMTGEFKLAKNVLTLGVVDSFGVIDPFSSHGPAFDGRIKPELVAFGIDGSSAAAALASGSALLLQQAFWERNGVIPPAALIKALLINGATDLGPKGVDHVYGYGNINAFQSLETLLAGRFISDTIAFDQSFRHNISIPEGVETFKMTLAWTDPPASIGAEKALVNDLDLEFVRLADGVSRLPQQLNTFPHVDSLAEEAYSGKDHLNNTEQIELNRPPAGNYEIRVEAYDFQVAEQVFHLAYDWDTIRSFQWLFPSRHNQIIPNKNFQEQLYWESSESTVRGTLSYSFNGENWNTIHSQVDLSTGSLHWSPPDTLAQALLRMQIGTDYFVTDTFTLAPQPSLQFVLNCEDSIAVSWTKEAGIDQYQFYRLAEKYMEPFRLTSDTFAVFQKEELGRPFIAFAPLISNDRTSVRSLTYALDRQAANCYAQNFSGEIVGEEALLYLNLTTDYGIETLELERLIGGQFINRGRTAVSNGKFFKFIDKDLQTGLNQYRVKLILANGTFVYSPVVELDYIQPDHFLLYPNPISRRGDFQILYNTSEPEKVLFQVYTALGAQVLSTSITDLETAYYADDFQSGIYFYRFVKDGQLLQSGKLVVR